MVQPIWGDQSFVDKDGSEALNAPPLKVRNRKIIMTSMAGKRQQYPRRRRPHWSSMGLVMAAAIISHSSVEAAVEASTINVGNFDSEWRYLQNDVGSDGDFEPHKHRHLADIDTRQDQDNVTPTPSVAPVPTASPVVDTTPPPTQQPTPSPSPQPITGSPSRRPTTSQPATTPSPLTTPSMSPSVEVVDTPAPDPTISPSDRPVVSSETTSPVRDPTELPTASPVVVDSPSPVRDPTNLPTASPVVVQTMSPVMDPTIAPSVSPVVVQTTSPVRDPTNLPSTSPAVVDMTTFLPSSGRTGNDTLVPVSVNLNPIEIVLIFDNPLIESEQQEVSDELDVVLADYLMQELSGEDFGAAELQGFDLTSMPTDNGTRLLRPNRLRRVLEEEEVLLVYRYNVEGSTNLATNSDTNEDDSNDLTRSVNEAVSDVFDQPDGAEKFTDFLQTSPDAGILASVSGAVGIPEDSDASSKKKPSLAAIIVGFTLVGLAVLSLLFYLYAFYKGYRKRAAEKERERQGVHASNTKPASPRRDIPPGFLATSTNQVHTGDDSSDDESSYQGVGSDDESEYNDTFARELKLAASLDKRKWNEFQQQKKSVDKEEEENEANVSSLSRNLNLGSDGELDQFDVRSDDSDERNENEGFEVTDTGSRLIIGAYEEEDKSDFHSALSGVSTTFPYGDEEPATNSTFPYGDEEEVEVQMIDPRADPPGPRSSNVIQSFSKSIHDPSGVRGSQLRILKSADRDAAAIDADENDWRDSSQRSNVREFGYTDKVGIDPALQLMDTLTSRSPASPTNRSRAMPRHSPTDSFNPSIPSSQAVNASLASSSKDESELFVPASSRGQLMPPAQLYGEDDDDDVSTEDEIEEPQSSLPSRDSVSSSLQSLLTIDIIKEVQKLSSFVKNYEQRRNTDSMIDSDQESASESSREMFNPGKDALLDLSDADMSVSSTDDFRPRPAALVTTKSRNKHRQRDFDDPKKVALRKVASTEEEEEEKYLMSKPKLPPITPESYVDPVVADEHSLESPVVESPVESPRLGITPFSVQQAMAAQQILPDLEATKRRIASRQTSSPSLMISKPTSRPPVTGSRNSATVLSPIPGTPGTDEEASPHVSTRTRSDPSAYSFPESPPRYSHTESNDDYGSPIVTRRSRSNPSPDKAVSGGSRLSALRAFNGTPKRPSEKTKTSQSSAYKKDTHIDVPVDVNSSSPIHSQRYVTDENAPSQASRHGKIAAQRKLSTSQQESVKPTASPRSPGDGFQSSYGEKEGSNIFPSYDAQLSSASVSPKGQHGRESPGGGYKSSYGGRDSSNNVRSYDPRVNPISMSPRGQHGRESSGGGYQSSHGGKGNSNTVRSYDPLVNPSSINPRGQHGRESSSSIARSFDPRVSPSSMSPREKQASTYQQEGGDATNQSMNVEDSLQRAQMASRERIVERSMQATIGHEQSTSHEYSELIDTQLVSTRGRHQDRQQPREKKKLSSLRHLPNAIADGDPDVISSLAPSDEGHTSRSPSPAVKSTPRKSKNKGFNNILSMFEAKKAEAIFPKDENWQMMTS